MCLDPFLVWSCVNWKVKENGCREWERKKTIYGDKIRVSMKVQGVKKEGSVKGESKGRRKRRNSLTKGRERSREGRKERGEVYGEGEKERVEMSRKGVGSEGLKRGD